MTRENVPRLVHLVGVFIDFYVRQLLRSQRELKLSIY